MYGSWRVGGGKGRKEMGVSRNWTFDRLVTVEFEYTDARTLERAREKQAVDRCESRNAKRSKGRREERGLAFVQEEENPCRSRTVKGEVGRCAESGAKKVMGAKGSQCQFFILACQRRLLLFVAGPSLSGSCVGRQDEPKCCRV